MFTLFEQHTACMTRAVLAYNQSTGYYFSDAQTRSMSHEKKRKYSMMLLSAYKVLEWSHWFDLLTEDLLAFSFFRVYKRNSFVVRRSS